MADRLAMAWPGLQVERVVETGSTNSDLLERVRAAGDHPFIPTLLIAERQRAGRGRRGRAWHSSAGRSLTASLASPLTASDWSGLSLVVGVALAEALDVPLPARRRIGLKWPNDLWLVDADGSGRKLGGVLIESLPRANARVVVIGIGLNVLPQAVDDASTGFACWQEIEPDASPERAIERVIAPLQHALAVFERDGFGAFADRFALRDVLRGHAVRTSAPELEGVSLGVNARGALRVRTAEGVREIESGEVSVRPMAGVGVRTKPLRFQMRGHRMLRLLLALLVAANALFYVWTVGWFDGLVPWHARGDREPDRITSQLHPEAVVVVQAGDPADISNGLCFEAGPITSADAGAAEGILNATLPAGSWTDVRGESPADRLGGGHVYRVSNIDAATAVKLADLKLDAAGRIGFRNCPTPVSR